VPNESIKQHPSAHDVPRMHWRPRRAAKSEEEPEKIEKKRKKRKKNKKKAKKATVRLPHPAIAAEAQPRENVPNDSIKHHTSAQSVSCMRWRTRHAAKSKKEPGKIEKNKKRKKRKKQKTKRGHHSVDGRCKIHANEARTVQTNSRNDYKRKYALRGARRRCGRRSGAGRIDLPKKWPFLV